MVPAVTELGEWNLVSDGSLAPEPTVNRSSTTSVEAKGMEDSNRYEVVYGAVETRLLELVG